MSSSSSSSSLGAQPPTLKVSSDDLTTELLFLEAIERLRSQWFGIILTIGFNQDFMETGFARCTADFRPHRGNSTIIFHEMFRCGNTGKFLWFLLTKGETPLPKVIMEENASRARNRENRHLLNNFKAAGADFDSEDITLYFVEIDGALPEHIFIVARIGSNYYLMQSFFSTYTFSSKYGMFKIENIDEFLDMLMAIQYFCELRYNEESSPPLDAATQKMYDAMEAKLAFYTNVKIPNLKKVTEDHRSEVDVSMMAITKHVIKKQDVALAMRHITVSICSGLENARASKSVVLTNPLRVFVIHLYNWMLKDAFTFDDLQDSQRFRDKLSSAIGFRGHNYRLDMVNVTYGEQINLRFSSATQNVETAKTPNIERLTIMFKMSVNLDKLVKEGLVGAFNCETFL